MKTKIKLMVLLLCLSGIVSAGELKHSTNKIAHEVIFNPTQIERSLDDTAKVLEESYLYADRVSLITNELKKRLAAGKFLDIKTSAQFVEQIGEQLREISGDGHLALYASKPQENLTQVPPETIENRKLNYAFEHIQILQNNIGYLKFNTFYQDQSARKIVDYAMSFLSQTDAMIIDLTESSGGSVEMVEYLLSYFLDEGITLWDMLDGENDSQFLGKTLAIPNSERFKNDYPLYVLTSDSVLSAGEFFTHTLKHLGRATVIGERTAGMAHWTGVKKVNEYINIRIPIMRPVNPVINGDWQGVGVTPDVEIAADKSFTAAVKAATKTLKH